MLAISRPSRLVIAVEADSRPRHAVERHQFPFVGGVYQGANVIKRRCAITRVRGNPFVGDWIDKDPIERGFVIVIDSTDVSLLISIAERKHELDRKREVKGKSVSVRVALGGRRTIKKTKTKNK